MDFKGRVHVVACLGLACTGWLIVAPVRAQITTGGVTGRVLDEHRQPLPGVVVTVRNPETGLERAATSAPDGGFELLGLPPATYAVQATLADYGAPLRTLVVNVGQRTPLIIAAHRRIKRTLRAPCGVRIVRLGVREWAICRLPGPPRVPSLGPRSGYAQKTAQGKPIPGASRPRHRPPQLRVIRLEVGIDVVLIRLGRRDRRGPRRQP